MEAQSKKTNDDSFNNSDSLTHSSANRNSVFDEINRGDDFEQDIIDDINEEASSSEQSGDSEDSSKVQGSQLEEQRKRDAQASKALVDTAASNIDKAIDAI